MLQGLKMDLGRAAFADLNWTDRLKQSKQNIDSMLCQDMDEMMSPPTFVICFNSKQTNRVAAESASVVKCCGDNDEA